PGCLRVRVRADWLYGWIELVSGNRPDVGADGALARRADQQPGAVCGRRARSHGGARDWAGRDRAPAPLRAQPARRPIAARLWPLDPAGAASGSQRRAARLRAFALALEHARPGAGGVASVTPRFPSLLVGRQT